MKVLVEKYRPKSFDGILGQGEVVENLKALSRSPERAVPHMLFSGPSGTGKTSVAMCLAKALFGEAWHDNFVEFNASDERGIEVVRQKLKRFAFTKGRRIIFLDESDAMTQDAQHALRRVLEKTKDTIFIFTCNYEHKIIDAIKSRCAIFKFKRLDDKLVLRCLLEICKNEGVKINSGTKGGFEEIVRQADGDLRWAINTLEKLLAGKKEITPKEVIAFVKPHFGAEAMKLALRGDFERAKNMLEDGYINARFDWQGLVNEMFGALSDVTDRDLKIRLYAKLAETEHRCRLGSNPLIQLVGFLSWTWVSPHLSRECPLKGVEK